MLAAIPFKGMVLNQVAAFWFDQTKDIFIGNRRDPEQFPKQIAFNVIGAEADDAATGRTREEHEIAGAIGALLGPAIAANKAFLVGKGLEKP